MTVNAIAPSAETEYPTASAPSMTRNVSAPQHGLGVVAFDWLANEAPQDVTARMFQAGNGTSPALEHRGRAVDDPVAVGPTVQRLVAEARKSAAKTGIDLD